MKKFFAQCFTFCVYEFALTYGTGILNLDQRVRAANGFIRNRVFKWMADVSYGVYLWHTLVLTLTFWFLLKTSLFANLPPIGRFVICILIVAPVVYAVATLLPYWLELPGIGLGRRLLSIRGFTTGCDRRLTAFKGTHNHFRMISE